MRRLRDPSDLATAPGVVAAIGNFDGVHLGHQAVLDATRIVAVGRDAPLGVLTFEPHPRQYFAPDAPPFRLTSANAKAHRLEKLGVQVLFEMPFDSGLASLSAEAFATDMLVGRLRLAHAVVGADFRFGRGRSGTAEGLKAMGAALGLGVTVVPMLDLGQGEVSSTAIRQALTDGRPRDAAAMLGHWHRIEGEVIRGDQRGRTLGYPTANMSMAGLHPPRFGVYAVSVDVLDGPQRGRYGGVASIGLRPMFRLDEPNCETHLFDFAGDLYGATLSVALVDYLRPEMSFDGLPALITQMDADSARARAALMAHA